MRAAGRTPAEPEDELELLLDAPELLEELELDELELLLDELELLEELELLDEPISSGVDPAPSPPQATKAEAIRPVSAICNLFMVDTFNSLIVVVLCRCFLGSLAFCRHSHGTQFKVGPCATPVCSNFDLTSVTSIS